MYIVGMNALLSLGHFLVSRGCTMSLVGGGSLLVSRSTDPVWIYENVKAVDDICFLTVFKDGEKIGRAHVMADGYPTCSPEENVIDFSDHPLFAEWFENFNIEQP